MAHRGRCITSAVYVSKRHDRDARVVRQRASHTDWNAGEERDSRISSGRRGDGQNYGETRRSGEIIITSLTKFHGKGKRKV